MMRSLAVALSLCLFASLSVSAQDPDARDRVRQRIAKMVDQRMADLRAELTALVDREIAAARGPAGNTAKLDAMVRDLRSAVERLAREVEALGGKARGTAGTPKGSRGGWLGLELAELTVGPHGAHVLRVLPGSPAEKAGVQNGDVIDSIAGMEIKTAREAVERTSAFAPGTSVLIGVQRGPFDLDLVAVVAPHPNDETLAKLRDQADDEPESPPVPAVKGGKGWLGVKLADLPGKDHGAHILSVEPDMPADRAGLQAGDVIVRIAGASVTTVEEAVSRTSSFAPGTAVLVVARRGPFEMTVEVTLGSRPSRRGK